MGSINQPLAREAAASGIRRAVETGTYFGTSAIVLSRLFERVETIELSPYYAMRAWLRLLRYRNVRLRFGDSSRLLRPSKEPTLYWLDGHWSAEKTAGEHRQCPLLDELRATSPGTFGDWYIIDDARLFTQPVTPPLDPEQWPALDEIESVVAQTRPGYEVSVMTDLDVVIVRPVSYS